MKIYEVNKLFFDWAIANLAGVVFHRVENNRYYLKPIKRYEKFVKPNSINELPC